MHYFCPGPLAAQIGLLKRDLSRSHDALRPHGGESAFLSIVTLVESALSQLKWKQYNNAQLAAIRSVLEVGYRQVRVGFGDYEEARRRLADRQVESTPRIDLASVKWDDIADDEQE